MKSLKKIIGERKGDAETLEKLERLKALAKKGDANAQFNLGLCYLKRESTQYEWYRKFLRPELMEEIPLVGFYEKEAGVKENPKAAFDWLQKAAIQGHVKAQQQVVFCYRFGKGVAKDEGEAVAWYRKAAEQEDEDAAEALERLEPQLRSPAARP